MKVLIDHHHDALRYSLQLLLEKRFGWQVFTQIGMEWYDEGLWNVYPARDTAQQFLGLDHASNPPVSIHGEPLPPSAVLNANYTFADGIYYVLDPVRERPYAAITLPSFKDAKFDILIASMPQHIPIFLEIQKRYQPQAKLIYQAGNAWNPDHRIKNFMGSIEPVYVPPDINACFYHQEFDLTNFHYELPRNHNKVYSYVHYMHGKEKMNQVAAQLPDWEFRSFGAGMEDSIMKSRDVSQKIRDSAFTWHYKPGGDGFGHSIFSSYACGRPAIIWGSQYRGKLAGHLFQDGLTCIDAEQHGDLATVLKRSSEPEVHKNLCSQAYGRFKETVNFEADFERIKVFMEKLR